MIRKIPLSAIILLFGLVFCFTNGFADENRAGVDENEENNRFTEDIFIPKDNIDDFQRVPHFIFGTRDFEKMRDLPTDSQDYILGRKVGLIARQNPNDPNQLWLWCTGFLVGPDLFMTNEHCVYDESGLFLLEGGAIFMDYYQELDVDPTAGGITARVSAVLRADAPKDYALLRLDRPIGDTYGWLELDTTAIVNTSQRVKIIQHPSGRSKEIVRRNSQIENRRPGVPPYELPYLADTEGGSSGAAVFLRNETGVIAIHKGGRYSDTNGNNRRDPGEPIIYNHGTLMSYIVPEIQQWLPGSPPPTPTGNLMYWSDVGTNKIQRANLDGTNVQDLVTGVKAWGIALDVQGGKMYWTNDISASKIQRANLDGTNVQDLVTTGLREIADIELDIAGGKMYWTDFEADKIQRANLDGTNVQDLVTGVDGVNGIALDIAGGKMYWSSSIISKIQRANLDGSNVQDLLTRNHGLNYPIGITLDVSAGKIYWANTYVNTSVDKIQRANLDGSNIENLITGLDHPQCIALDVASGKMYWTERYISKIQRADLDGSHIEDFITHGLKHPRDIALGILQASGTLTFDPSTIADQTFTVGTYASVSLPIATGGAAPYTYTLTPKLSGGLRFDPIDRWIGGTPTTVMARTSFTYTVTDARRASVSLPFKITVIASGGNLDVNRDGRVDVLDLILVAVFYGTRGNGLPADVNADGIVNVQDFAAVAAGVDAANALPLQGVEEALLILAQQAGDIEAAAEAPMGFGTPPQHVRSAGIAYRNVADALTNVRHFASGDVRLVKSVALLERLLSYLREMATIPEMTALLPNYPNPFNPETWIPYHLATDAEVIVTIYDMRGVAVRALVFGHQPAGVYERRGRAAYWDGKNQLGEPVASGVYFYTLTAGEFTATRKLLITK